MKRYLFFGVLALLLHSFMLVPFLIKPLMEQAASGGGTGASIQVTMQSALVIPSPDKVSQKKLPSQAAPKISGFDRNQGQQHGQGKDHSAGPAAGTGSGIQGDHLILAEIRRRIEQAKRYPVMAQQRGVQGMSEVSFQITQQGSVDQLKLVRSSGATILDRAALKTVRQAAPFPYYPESIRIGIKFTMEKN